jgi:hypothetical protein
MKSLALWPALRFNGPAAGLRATAAIGPRTGKKMRPRPDHGEESYQGFGRLKGRRTMTLAYAREGADVVMNYLSNEEANAQKVLKLFSEAGVKMFSNDVTACRSKKAGVMRFAVVSHAVAFTPLSQNSSCADQQVSTRSNFRT